MFSLMTRRNRKRGLGLFDDPFFDDFFNMPVFFDNRRVMRTDVREDDKNYYLDVELPGIEKKDIKLSLENGYLTIAVEREENKEQKDEQGNYVRRELLWQLRADVLPWRRQRGRHQRQSQQRRVDRVGSKKEAADKKKYITIE